MAVLRSVLSIHSSIERMVIVSSLSNEGDHPPARHNRGPQQERQSPGQPGDYRRALGPDRFAMDGEMEKQRQGKAHHFELKRSVVVIDDGIRRKQERPGD